MKAAVVTAPNSTPLYIDFEEPAAKADEQIVTVHAAALSNLTKARASGSHYSAAGIFPAIAGTDGVGVTPDGRRVYFAMPEAPFGTLAQRCPVHPRRWVDIPDTLDDVTAAALANPGMSAWGALVERAHLVAGETVLVNGATGTAGRVAVQLAKYLGASKVIATGRSLPELERVKSLGADVIIPFALAPQNTAVAQDFEEALAPILAEGVDVVVDYVWGQSAQTLLLALAKTIEDKPVRFVHTGGISGEPNIQLPGSALRSCALTLMGSGIGSLSRVALVQSIRHVFEAFVPAGLKIDTRSVPLSEVETVWPAATGKPRVVFTIS